MKKIFFLIIACAFFNNLFAQYPLKEGKVQLNAGVGFSSSNTPIYVGFDYGLKSDLTLGGEMVFHKSGTGILANINYHFNELMNLNSKFNLYAGVNLSAFMLKSTPTTSSKTNFNLGGQLGARYQLSSSIALNLEFGIGNSINEGKLGITARL
jgi:outer membrane immunogenic protein